MKRLLGVVSLAILLGGCAAPMTAREKGALGGGALGAGAGAIIGSAMGDHRAGKGALIGGTTLAVIGLGLVVVVSTVSIGFGPPPDPSATKFVAITFGFATAGAVVGGMVGALTPSWKTVHTWAGF